MPSNDPIGSLFKAAGLAPVRSTPKSSSPADTTKDAPQPTRGFLSSLRRVQRDGSNGSRTSTTPDSDGKVATPVTPKDPTVPEARQVAPSESDAPPPDAAAADAQSASLAAFVAEAKAAAEAATVVIEPEAQAASTDSSVALEAPPPQVTDEIPLPVPSQVAPAVRRSVSAMPSALQEWLSAKPAIAAKVETTAAAAPMLPETATAKDTAPGDATETMPPGLQMALSAAMASQAATQSGSPTKASTDAPVATVGAARTTPIVVAAVSPANLPATEPEPTTEQFAPVIPATAQDLPPQAAATTHLPTAAPVTEVAVKVATAAPVELASEEHPPVTQDRGTPTAPTASPLAIPVPSVATSQTVQPTIVKSDDVPQAVIQVAAAVGPQNLVATPEIRTAAKSSASSARKSDSTQAPLEISAAATTDSSSGSDSIVFETLAAPDDGERPSAAVRANEVVPETVLPAVTTQDAAASQQPDGASLGPLTAGRSESSPVAAPTAPVVQVAPHDSQALVDAVSQLVLKSHDSGQQLSLQITPPDLGTVRIEVHSHGGILTARLEADSPAARQLLAEHLPQLREALQQQGANVDRIDVYQSDRSAQGEGTADSNWQSSQQDQRNEAAPLLYDDEDASEPVPTESRGSLALGELNIRV